MVPMAARTWSSSARNRLAVALISSVVSWSMRAKICDGEKILCEWVVIMEMRTCVSGVGKK